MSRSTVAIPVFILFLAIWEGFCRTTGIPAFLLPAPSRIAVTMAASGPLLLRHGFVTLWEIALGVTGAVAVAVPLALAMFALPGFERSLTPFLVTSQAVPVFALAPILVFWLGYGMASKVLVAGLVIFFPITVALLDGLKSCDPDLDDLFVLMGAPFAVRLRLLYLPQAMPWFLSGLRVGVTVSTIGAVIGEWVGAQEGLGYLMLQGNARLRTDLVFAAITVLSGMGLALWFGIGALENKFLAWRGIPSRNALPARRPSP
jgi:putative hydroxymethylpyrimidine transport system permease protein